jgi:hypothetical protein
LSIELQLAIDCRVEESRPCFPSFIIKQHDRYSENHILFSALIIKNSIESTTICNGKIEELLHQVAFPLTDGKEELFRDGACRVREVTCPFECALLSHRILQKIRAKALGVTLPDYGYKRML